MHFTFTAYQTSSLAPENLHDYSVITCVLFMFLFCLVNLQNIPISAPQYSHDIQAQILGLPRAA